VAAPAEVKPEVAAPVVPAQETPEQKAAREEREAQEVAEKLAKEQMAAAEKHVTKWFADRKALVDGGEQVTLANYTVETKFKEKGRFRTFSEIVKIYKNKKDQYMVEIDGSGAFKDVKWPLERYPQTAQDVIDIQIKLHEKFFKNFNEKTVLKYQYDYTDDKKESSK